MKHKKKIAFSVGVVAMGLVLVTGTLSADKESKVVLEGNPKGKQVNVGQVVKQDIQAKIAATGMLQAKDAERVYAEVNTQVEEVHVEVGDTVKKGDVLITFSADTKENLERDLEQLELQLASARISLNQMQQVSNKNIGDAELNVTAKQNAVADCEENIRKTDSAITLAKEDLQKATDQYELIKELYDSGLESKNSLDEAIKVQKRAEDQVLTLEGQQKSLHNNLEMAKKQVEQATYDRDLLAGTIQDETKAQNIQMKQNDIASLEIRKEALVEQLNKATTQIVAPTDGVVSNLNVTKGQFVTPGAELIKLINPEQLVVKAEVSPFYSPQLIEGLKVIIKYNGSTTIETTGTVSMVSPVAIQKPGATNAAAATAIPVDITLDTIDGLKEGLIVDLKIITDEVKDVVAVPLLATLEDQEDEAYVFVVGEEGILEKRYVKEGAANNNYVQVSDLEEGELVVTNPTEALEDGMAVSYKGLPKEKGDK